MRSTNKPTDLKLTLIVRVDRKSSSQLSLVKQDFRSFASRGSEISHKRVAHFIAIKNHIRQLSIAGDNLTADCVSSYIEVLHHLCKLRNWPSILEILSMPVGMKELSSKYKLPFYEFLEFKGLSKMVLYISEEILSSFSCEDIDIAFVHIIRARAFQSMSEYSKAREVLKTLCLTPSSISPQRYFEANALLGMYQIRSSMFKEGSKKVEESIREIDKLSTAQQDLSILRLKSWLLSNLAWRDMRWNNHQSAWILFSQSLDIARNTNYITGEISALAHQGIIFRRMCTPLHYICVRVVNNALCHFFQTIGLNQLSIMPPLRCHLAKNYTLAKHYLAKGKSRAEELENEGLISFFYDHLGWVALNEGDLELAEEYCRLAMRGYKEIDGSTGLSHSWQHLGRIYVAKGNEYINDAEQMFKNTLQKRRQGGNIGGVGSCFCDLSVVFWHKGKYILAMKYLFISIYYYWKAETMSLTRCSRILSFYYIWTVGRRDWTP